MLNYRDLEANLLKYFNRRKYLSKLVFIILFSIPIIIIFLPYLTQPNTIMIGDFEYFTQLYEAFRISVIKYQQFPWFNPWVAGGVPLYANPQFGLISIQSITVMIFGTLIGLKIAVMIYASLGMWGMYSLLRYNNASMPRSILLSYIFVLGGFGIYHITGGHLTFAVYYLIPFLLYFYQIMLKESKWLPFALLFSLCLLTASHYIIIQFILILSGIIMLSLWKNPYSKSRKDLIFLYLKSFALIILLTFHKLFFSYQYLKSYPRIGNESAPVSIFTLIKSLLIPPSSLNHIQPAGLNHSWGEYSAYSGLILLLVFIFMILFLIKNKKIIDQKITIILLILVGSVLLAMGRFSKYSPYNILQEMPIYSSMIVPSRWMGWFFMSMVILVGLIKLPKSKDRILCLVLFVSIIEMTVFTMPYIKIMNPNTIFVEYKRKENNFQQYDNFEPADRMRYFKATRSNLGEVRGYEAILDYNYYRPTNRCGINKGCGFVLTNNATLDYWSPNRINISRTGPGEIKLNINPGSYWLVNGKRLWPNEKVVVLNKDFSLNDSQQKYELTISPSLSLSPQ
jgi:hypothetical protein